MKSYYILLSILLSCFVLNAQEKRTKKADKKFDNYEFENSKTDYEYLLSKGYTTSEIYIKLGNANYYNARYTEALPWYKKLISSDSIPLNNEYYYRYVQCLKSTGAYAESDKIMNQFAKNNPNDNRAEKFYSNKGYLGVIKENSGRYTLKNYTINSEFSDMAPSFYGEKLVFASARDTGVIRKNVHVWSNNAFKDLYVTSITDSLAKTPVKFSKELNLKTEESTTTFTKDGKTVYFTRSNFVKKRFKRDIKKVSRLKLYKATLKDSIWSNIIELPFNSDEYSVAHPALSPDEKTLYFASNMPGTIGESDIFKVDINTDKSYGKPINLGKNVNTEGRETFPFATSNSLYFSSDGHPGLGGLDIYKVAISGNFDQEIFNVGKPINGTQDDFGYIINETTKEGFYTSNKTNNDDNIYGFKEHKPLEEAQKEFTFTAIVKEEYTLKPVFQSKIEIIDNNGDKIVEKFTNVEGFFDLKTKLKNDKYKMLISKNNYETVEYNFEINDLESNYEVEIALLKKIYKKSKVGEDLATILELGPQALYFDFNRADILPKSEIVLKRIIEYLNKYSDISIDIRSYTDASGNDNYNMQLSSKRAKSTSNYLVLNGIDATRVTSKGYGETQLVNDCKNAQNCTEEQNKLNRRSEFIVVNPKQ